MSRQIVALAWVTAVILVFLVTNLRSSLVSPAFPFDCDFLPPPAPRTENEANTESTCGSLCKCLIRESLRNDATSTASLWRRYSSSVLDASLRLEEAPNKTKEYQAWVEHLFSLTTTSRLIKSFETFPQDLQAILSISSILERRFQNNTPGPPLQVAIFGGSVTAGHGCLENPLGLPTQSFLKRQVSCAWPSRVQHLLDTFAPGLVNITNMAMAATTSDVGATVVEYQLWPAELLPNGPDVIIASFATNDALAEATETEIYQNMQLLVEAVHKERNCRSDKLPLLIYVDDFIAWPGSLQKWLGFHHDLHELADWHGFGFISYANAFRDVVHADLLRENSFKGEWKINKGKYTASPHPGLSFHIIMSWVMSYNLHLLGMHVCDVSLQVEPLSMDLPVASIPSVQRPPLNPELLTEEISSQWKSLETTEKKRCASIKAGPRCGFVWVANRVSEFRTAAAIQDFLQIYLTHNDGWKGNGNSYRSKHGWVAEKAKARFELHVKKLKTDVRTLSILALKSYGEEWKGSRVRMTVGDQEFFIEGSHNSTTSVIVPHKFALNHSVTNGNNLKVSFDLVSGKTFKITGMAFCNS